jgi:Zn-dependent protease
MDTLDIVFQIAILVMSVVIHEVSHGYVAGMLGDPTARLAGRLSLNPIRHLDPVGSIIVPILTAFSGFTFGWAKPVPVNPYNLRGGQKGEGLVAAAGPLSNLLIALIFGLIIRFGAAGGLLSLPILKILVVIVLINITLCVFNLMPAPPLDGSKILFALLPSRFIRIQQWAEQSSIILIIIFVFFLWQYFEPVILSLFKLLTGMSF